MVSPVRFRPSPLSKVFGFSSRTLAFKVGLEPPRDAERKRAHCAAVGEVPSERGGARNDGHITETDRTRTERGDTNVGATTPSPTEQPGRPVGSNVPGTLELSQTTFIVEDTATAASLHLFVRNLTDTLSIIDRVDPSCGCIMATVQRRNARPGDSAEIYIGLMPEQMSTTQPYTVDVYMSSHPNKPYRLTIWKREAYENRE